VDSKLNLAHVARKKYKKKKLKQTNASADLVQYRFKIREGSPEGSKRLWRKGFELYSLLYTCRPSFSKCTHGTIRTISTVLFPRSSHYFFPHINL